MKKFLLLLIIGIFTSSVSFSQDIELMKKGGATIVDDTIHIATSNDSTLIEVPVYVKNNSTKAMDIKVKVEIKNMVEGSTASYCWGGNCFAIETLEPEAFATISASDTSKEFHSDFNPKKLKGTTEFTYTFYNKNNTDESASVTIFYEIITSTGIPELSEITKSISSYPNPVQNTLCINYDLIDNAVYNISVYDIVGKKVANQKASILENKSEIDVSNFKPGIYIWTFEINGVPVKSDKFIKR